MLIYVSKGPDLVFTHKEFVLLDDSGLKGLKGTFCKCLANVHYLFFIGVSL